jgi:RNA polymerase primary sigma factor
MSDEIARLSSRFGRKEHEPLTPERESELGEMYQIAQEDNDDAAIARIREEVIMRHMRLIVHIGKSFTRVMDWDEIISAGSLALTQAVNRWDPAKGQVYPWAERWITSGLTRAADAQRTIRIPQGVAYKAGMAQKRITALEAELGRTLTPAERAEVVGNGPTFDTLPMVDQSLDQEYGDWANASGAETRTLGDSITDEDADPAGQVEKASLIESVRKAILELSDLEKEVVMIRFGIDDRERMTLAQLGERHGVTGEAMRRIEATALAKLRHPALINPIAMEE